MIVVGELSKYGAGGTALRQSREGSKARAVGGVGKSSHFLCTCHIFVWLVSIKTVTVIITRIELLLNAPCIIGPVLSTLYVKKRIIPSRKV